MIDKRYQMGVNHLRKELAAAGAIRFSTLALPARNWSSLSSTYWAIA